MARSLTNQGEVRITDPDMYKPVIARAIMEESYRIAEVGPENREPLSSAV